MTLVIKVKLLLRLRAADASIPAGRVSQDETLLLAERRYGSPAIPEHRWRALAFGLHDLEPGDELRSASRSRKACPPDFPRMGGTFCVSATPPASTAIEHARARRP